MVGPKECGQIQILETRMPNALSGCFWNLENSQDGGFRESRILVVEGFLRVKWAVGQWVVPDG